MKLWMFAGVRRNGRDRNVRRGTAPALPSALKVMRRPANGTLTAVPGIKVGHHTLTERPTGCTVVLIEGGATASVDVRGAAPATRDTDLLNPAKMVEQIQGIALSGGSIFGLSAADGVLRYLEEKNVGIAYGRPHIPIVPGASIFDLGVGDASIRPTADCGYRAAQAASSAAVPEGSVGAGAGATLGKLAGHGARHEKRRRQRGHRHARRPHHRRARRCQSARRRHRSGNRKDRRGCAWIGTSTGLPTHV